MPILPLGTPWTIWVVPFVAGGDWLRDVAIITRPLPNVKNRCRRHIQKFTELVKHSKCVAEDTATIHNISKTFHVCCRKHIQNFTELVKHYKCVAEDTFKT